MLIRPPAPPKPSRMKEKATASIIGLFQGSALTQPKAAIVFRKVAANATLATPTEPTFDGTTVTVPTVDGVEYRNADTNAVLTTAAPVTLADGQTLNVVAVPTAGRYFANSENDQWSYTNPA